MRRDGVDWPGVAEFWLAGTGVLVVAFLVAVGIIVGAVTTGAVVAEMKGESRCAESCAALEATGWTYDGEACTCR